MSKIIIFTDLHMVLEGETIIGLDPYQRLSRGIDHVNLHHRDAEFAVMTGDLSHRGSRQSYARLRELLDTLEIPVHLLVGNHDNRENFIAAYPESPRDEHGFIQQRIETENGVMLLLDTLCGPPYVSPDVHAGVLCDNRLAWLKQNLTRAGDRPVYIFMHHPPLDTGFPGMDKIKLRNGEEFYDILAEYGNVRHIFAGHVHRTIGGSHRGIPFSVFKSPVHQQPMVFDTEDTSLSVDEPGAYGIVFLKPQGCLVHVEDYELSNHSISGSDALGN
ncbi:phosphodiesterase [Rhizobium sp. B21/90]|uniref:2', 3'cyclic nucleotide phosphodiesterase SpdA n=1 Tax=Rhizobium sp. B21/90 TaxID=2819993 RepID=UPI001C5B7C10|nr:phosphodiesterase [Rhizobium sp. B21/90]QYA03765.1 phosphodiesterase [Rhizobium sp. B21/90]